MEKKDAWDLETLCRRCNELGLFWPQTESDARERRACAQRKVKHVRQRLAWDCGLACVLMVTNRSWQEAHSICGTRSIWTVDLAYLLAEFRIRLLFLTRTLGCDPSYRELSFYQRDLGGDQERIQILFEKRQKWISKASLSSESLLALLRAGFVIIALVDLRFLRPCDHILHSALFQDDDASNEHLAFSKNKNEVLCEKSESTDLGTDFRQNAYTGHYILLVGVLSRGSAVLYKDPASTAPYHAINLTDLENARTAYGTDEDLIIVDLVDDDYS